MVIYGSLFVEATELILQQFEAVRSSLHYSIWIRLSLSVVNVAFIMFMCNAFTYCVELTRHTVSVKKYVNFIIFLFCCSMHVLVEFYTEFTFIATIETFF